MADPIKVTLGYYQDSDTKRKGISVGITNISPAPFNRVELAWVFQMPRGGKLETHGIPFSYAEGVEGQPLQVGQQHTFAIPPEQFFEVHLVVQATPAERSWVVAKIDGRQMAIVRGQDFEQLVKGCHPQEGSPEMDVTADRVQYIVQLVRAIVEQAQGYKVHPPKDVTAHSAVLQSDDVANKLDGTKWWLKFADGREELLSFRELMLLTYNVFIIGNRLNHQFADGGSSSGKTSVSLTMRVPHIMTKEGIQSLMSRLHLEGIGS